MTSRTSRLTSLVLLLLLPLIAGAQELRGRVVRVIDGDTLVLLLAGNQEEQVRLGGIDCPERGRAGIRSYKWS